MKVCYVCFKMFEGDHDCEVARKLAENPVKYDGPYIHSDAIPTRDQSVRK